MFKIFEPGRIFVITSKAHKYVMFLFVVVICIGLLEALVFSPEDYKQGDSVRIMYVHVPAAWISLGIFSSITFLSLIGYAMLAQKLIKWITANPKTINTISASVLVIIAAIIVVTQQY